ncbi:MAG: hypothetical protein M3Q37_00985 [Gemmatimonadota bacterium]|nr:hypothetical protein [Gemmatimonadota bacterium]
MLWPGSVFKIAMSLDGFTAGPEQSRKNPLGIGGNRLHDWAIPLAAWRAMHGLPGGEVDESSDSRLRNLIGECDIRPLTHIAGAVTF